MYEQQNITLHFSSARNANSLSVTAKPKAAAVSQLRLPRTFQVLAMTRIGWLAMTRIKFASHDLLLPLEDCIRYVRSALKYIFP